MFISIVQEPKRVRLPNLRPRTRYKIQIVSSNRADRSFFRPRTELGRRLWEIRMRRIESGGRLLGAEEIEQEILARRGGLDSEGV